MDIGTLLSAFLPPQASIAILAALYLNAWAMTKLPVPTRPGAYRLVYGVLNLLAANTDNARNLLVADVQKLGPGPMPVPNSVPPPTPQK